MRRKSCSKTHIIIVMGILLVSLCALGIGYAAWTDRSNVDTYISTGLIDVIFDENQPVKMEIADMSMVDNEISIQNSQSIDDHSIEFKSGANKKQAEVSFDNEIMLEDLAKPNKFLILTYPLDFNDGSTVRSVNPKKADLTLPCDEQIELISTSSSLIVNGNEYLLPENFKDKDINLYADVYRQIDVKGSNVTGKIFLRLTDSSIALINDANEINFDASDIPENLKEVAASYANGSTSSFDAELNTKYSFSVQLFVEQG